MRERGARLIHLPSTSEGQVDLPALLMQLGAADIRSIMVEGGAAIIASLIRQQLAHHAVVTIAPRYIPGLHITASKSQVTASLQDATYTQAGNDIIVWGKMISTQDPTDKGGSTATPINNFASPSLSTTASSTISPL